MNLTSELAGETLIVRVGEHRIDAAVAVLFKDRVVTLTAGAPPRVVLDLEAVEFLDSSGLGAIVAIMKLLQPDTRLDLAALHPTVAKVFKLTRMDQVMKIHDDMDAARRACADPV